MTKCILLATVILFAIIPNSAFALRCGNELASIGDLKHEVKLACGTPISKEVIGFIDQEKEGDRIRVLKIEEWIVESSSRYYSLVFEGNTLVKVESAGEKK